MTNQDLISKIEMLSGDQKNQVTNFIDLLLAKSNKLSPNDIKQSLNDFNNGDAEVIEVKEDLESHFKKVGL